jgi:uncharacterized membrane protein YphA (DoxX/SURF4 family)
MQKLMTPGRIFFAVGIIALGTLQFFVKDYIIGRPPSPAWSATIPGKIIWAYVSGAFFIIAGLAIILHWKARLIAFVIGITILLCSFLLRHLPQMFTSSWEGILWSINAYKSLALAGGAFIVAASFMKEHHNYNRFFTKDFLLTLSCIFIAIFFIDSGLAHFKFHDFIINDFIPAYIPFHPFWTYFCGIALIAAGLGIIIKQTRKWAAALAGLMILLWFFLLHIPRVSAAPNDYGEWMGVCESFSFSGILFVLAGISSQKETAFAGSLQLT